MSSPLSAPPPLLLAALALLLLSAAAVAWAPAGVRATTRDEDCAVAECVEQGSVDAGKQCPGIAAECCTAAQVDQLKRVSETNCFNADGACCAKLSDFCADAVQQLACSSCDEVRPAENRSGVVTGIICFDFAREVFEACRRDEFYEPVTKSCTVIGDFFDGDSEEAIPDFFATQGRHWVGVVDNVGTASNASRPIAITDRRLADQGCCFSAASSPLSASAVLALLLAVAASALLG